MTILVTGGAGFIGANFVRDWLAEQDEPVVNLDRLTYAGNLRSLADLAGDDRHRFVHGDICDRPLVADLLAEHRPRAIVHLAAESHVDRSIAGAEEFIRTNVTGTFRLLDTARGYWASLGNEERKAFRFVNVSTDEVYGSLSDSDPPFTESSHYAPNSPYSASKSAGDHLARAFARTYGLPVITTHCSNNYGPLQFPEKLIPLLILHALESRPLPVYGDGGNVRDWLYVADHCAALRRVLEAGEPGEVYNAGGNCEMTNLEVVDAVCRLLDEIRPAANGRSYRDLVTFVEDRPGHDRRYAVDTTKLAAATGWRPAETFASGLRKTVDWYLDNPDWIADVASGDYRQWIDLNYGKRAALE